MPSWADPMMAPLIDHNRIAEVYEGTVGSREFERVSRRRIHWMCSRVAGSDVLDIGCSQGIASILLAREGHQVVGIDREHEAIRAARDRLDEEEPDVRRRVEFRVGEGRAVGFPDASFDAVLLGEVLEHQLDPWKLLKEARRVLRPGGRIVITTPYGVHPYPDHKEPLYLSALLERLSSKLSIAEIALVDRYAAIVAERSKERAPGVWRRALRVAEGRLADQDETVETLRALVDELRRGTRALERSLQEAELTNRAAEIQTEAALRDVAQTRERLHTAQAEADGLRDSLTASEARNAKLEEELADIRGRFGYRIGRFLRGRAPRPLRRRRGRSESLIRQGSGISHQ
jgi:2-polyprenyl-3-methyl-5-hydroxy-6-metoxy-1,4-benzoquinol methylase